MPFPDTVVLVGERVEISPDFVAVTVTLTALVIVTEITCGLLFLRNVTDVGALIEQPTGVGDGDGDPLGEGEGEAEGDGDGVGDPLGVGEGEGVGDGDGVGEAEGLGDGEALGLGDGLAPGVA